MKRRTVLGAAAAAAAVPTTAAFGAGMAKAATRSAAHGLVFDEATYTTVTETITTDTGDKEVTYHFYGPLTYVTRPSDATHQSLVISVPVTIDGRAVDATRAPVVLANGIGGYFPSSVASATGVGQSTMEMGGGAPGGPGDGGAPGGPGGGGAPGGGAMVSIPKLALAAGYVVAEPGARGRTLTDAGGTYYGTAPAAIVDLKAAVRYLRANKGRVPGDTDRIVSTGTSAGGALSSLLGASGDSHLYTPYLKEAGAADASDAVFATGAWCPITDLEHADMAYEWCWSDNVTQATGAQVDRTVSRDLTKAFADYQTSLRLRTNRGVLRASDLDDHILRTYLRPAATRYLAALTDTARTAYLAANPFITWSAGQATFSWRDFTAHVGPRKKGAPAFDAFDLSAGENNEYGTGTTAARHFTTYSLREDTGSSSSRLDGDIPGKLALMNPMHHIAVRNPSRSKHWWLRVGTGDTDSSPVIVSNLALALENLGDDVDPLMYWDEGHGANTDAADFLAWIAKVTGHRQG
ncbi:Tat pathway signal sequence domain protein [Streptomyces sp. SID10853]|uniref:subtype B tannase n=1 Tax=Streptomyces sp. SID10853 TaxID=2706028 RepID=UPI0013BFE78D|nr:Tat pathway signal sequence domain protein [Streptomyces sp. SID10853]